MVKDDKVGVAGRVALLEERTNTASSAEAGGVKALFKRKKGKRRKGSSKERRAPAPQPAANGNGEHGPITGGPVNPIKGGRLSPHFQLPLDSKGAYLVLPAEQLEGAFDSEKEREEKRGKVPLTDPIVLYSTAGRLTALVQSIPLIVGTAGAMALTFFTRKK
ncbi:hypothetical protein HOP50_08g52840 [Chloropicon primus]|uniref:Uncharacterized protein n=1 Tax=Chloropicon primus TaxID=1764295 RepID=A0A5B8MQJ1_9CHLO|nr:hypothetical protein A3770_08p52540 [Chloropicon primus]UPR01960.1 hypothetical protein HOP50_08g52840 [Chloropicon primus]|mmetsp:Transcript_3107/g.8495  ORF Transcript_3107/g.8495 Transcript_3107/m.8495 type:complete len:162 (-) Transcript_3107:2401-2886(-)|eukprot:QDZ22736.1 hypothetical protein A3770_08p52540 [Chloropicon primus]